MKSILLSIKPKWVAKILNGEKTIEIRKTMPKCDLPIDVYIYCTKDNHQRLIYTGKRGFYPPDLANGKVVAKFTLNKVEEIYYECGNNGISIDGYKWFYTEEIDIVQDFEKSTCLNEYELFNYLQPKEAGGTPCGYAWHISNLVIFDEPKYLCDFWNTKKGVFCCPLTKAPQNYCYIETEN